jgi:hypothetical protein
MKGYKQLTQEQRYHIWALKKAGSAAPTWPKRWVCISPPSHVNCAATADSDFTSMTDAAVEKAMQRLNQRPRKTLGFTTPHQVFPSGIPSIL